ncbi:hypothetical protein, partial [Methylomicrobium sp. Wu6]|uniref:hypothetical protein n=1 Tax=Methylomicrobium sp. Wu6 TaxID=3107928 RepID=UPI002DD64F33
SGEGWDEGIKIKYFSLFLILLTPTLSSRRGSFLLNLTALVLILQHLYDNLSDDKQEFQIRDRLSFIPTGYKCGFPAWKCMIAYRMPRRCGLFGNGSTNWG